MDTSILSDESHTFVIAEAGSNWKIGNYDADVEQAKNLIKIAAEAGADAIKFQTFRSSTLYAKNAGISNYLSKQGIMQEINDMFEHLSMPYDMIPELYDYCKKQNIMFMSTPFSVQDAKKIDPFVLIYKVASYEINHVRLLEYLAGTKKPILLSTGASTYSDIDFAIDLIRKNGNNNIGLLQCTAKYPAPMHTLNLAVITNFKSKYGLPVGLSDHSTDPIIGPILAIGFGATVIEKHFTSDKTLPGPDHKFALLPEELRLLIKSIRLADQAKGSYEKRILVEENELANFAKRSIQAIKEIHKGDALEEGKNFEVLRPGNRKRGLSPQFLSAINGKKSLSDVATGDGINEYE